MNKNIVLCGVGGQGTVLASKLIAAAAIGRDLQVMSAETIGMAQKGGNVFSHLRLGDEIYSPMIASGTADMIIGFEPGETVRMLPYLKPQGWVVVNSCPVKPVTALLSGSDYDGPQMVDYLRGCVENLVVLDCAAACRELGSPRVTNIVLLGAAQATGELGLTQADLRAAIEKRMKPALHELNFRALAFGAAQIQV